MTRSELLYSIELILKSRHGINCGRLDSIPKLRSALPGYDRAIKDLADIKTLLNRLRRCDIGAVEPWRIKPPPLKKGPKKSKLTSKQIRAMRSDGLSVVSIAKAAGISRSRIYQILNQEAANDH